MVSFTLRPLYPRERYTPYPLDRRKGEVHAVAKRKILCPCRELNLGRPASSLVTLLTELSRLTDDDDDDDDDDIIKGT
jgi:hypothetical protein